MFSYTFFAYIYVGRVGGVKKSFYVALSKFIQAQEQVYLVLESNTFSISIAVFKQSYSSETLQSAL